MTVMYSILAPLSLHHAYILDIRLFCIIDTSHYRLPMLRLVLNRPEPSTMSSAASAIMCTV